MEVAHAVRVQRVERDGERAHDAGAAGALPGAAASAKARGLQGARTPRATGPRALRRARLRGRTRAHDRREHQEHCVPQCATQMTLALVYLLYIVLSTLGDGH